MHNSWLQAKGCSISLLCIAFTIKVGCGWLRLAAEYGGWSQWILTSPLICVTYIMCMTWALALNCFKCEFVDDIIHLTYTNGRKCGF